MEVDAVKLQQLVLQQLHSDGSLARVKVGVVRRPAVSVRSRIPPLLPPGSSRSRVSDGL